MAATPGTITLPVRLIVGESDPIELGTVDVPVRYVGGRVEIGEPDSEIAALLDQSARALREGDDDAASGNG